jgi:hypothetical protein
MGDDAITGGMGECGGAGGLIDAGSIAPLSMTALPIGKRVPGITAVTIAGIFVGVRGGKSVGC